MEDDFDPRDRGAAPFSPPPFVEPEVLSDAEQEAVVVAEVLDGTPPADAGQIAGLSSRHAGAAVLRRPHVREELRAALEARGIGPARLARVIDGGLKARRPSITYRDGSVAVGGADHAVRHKFLQTALELHGARDAAPEQDGDSWEALIVRVRARRAARGEQ